MRPATAVALAGGAIALVGCGSGGTTATGSSDDGTTTAPVQRTTLVTRQTVSGTLGYGDARSVLNRRSAGEPWPAPCCASCNPVS